ncbi:class I SAM-dependent methyltransferase [Candidatus Chloroploca asiatica]|uniref:Methyltransferase type 11 n=1 Tax=Candidatus Chloroploca asiatica TaxID=1506545 RepID=A0A2H3KJL4_9CHLR|nr:class I SAM-dependent methyltransferase [Candidatus Chloroploca asiatica]PDV98078.1 methyltransferase type 11 [Candidatus Chloroploca asiatica]
MYVEALEYLACPQHPEVLLELIEGAEYDDQGELITGELRCPTCGMRATVREGLVDVIGTPLMPESIAQLANVLPVAAWGYERTWRPQSLSLLAGEPFDYNRELPLLVGLTMPERGGLIVDVACSNGLYARTLEQARQGTPGHVIGIDHSLAMLQQARAYALAEGLRITYVRAKAQALPFAPGAAATMAMGGSLNEIGDIPTALRELRRVLDPTGRCVLMNLVQAEELPARALQGLLGAGGVAFPAVAEVNRLFALAGLRLRAQWQYGVVLFSLVT